MLIPINVIFLSIALQNCQISFDNETITNSKIEKLTEIKTEQNLRFYKHVVSVCNKMTHKLYTFFREHFQLKFDQSRNKSNYSH